MFSLLDKLVYPGQGVVEIIKISEKNVGGSKGLYYELRFVSKEVKIWVPVIGCEASIRPLSSREKVVKALEVLRSPVSCAGLCEFASTFWSKRNRAYRTKVSSGKLKDLSEVYRDLKYFSKKKGLSFGEKDLLEKVESLMAEEISFVSGVDIEDVVKFLGIFFLSSSKKKDFDVFELFLDFSSRKEAAPFES